MAIIDSFFDYTTVALLVEHYGGRRLSVPTEKRGQAWERLVGKIGEDRAASMVRFCGGEVIPIPMAANERAEETIRNLHQAGTPASEIAQMTFIRRYSERQIYRICAAKAA